MKFLIWGLVASTVIATASAATVSMEGRTYIEGPFEVRDDTGRLVLNVPAGSMLGIQANDRSSTRGSGLPPDQHPKMQHRD